MGIKNRQDERKSEKDPGQPTGEFDQNIGRLCAENVFGDRAAEGCAQAFAFGPLHQDDKDHEQRDQHPEREKYVNQDQHWDGQYGEKRAVVNDLVGD